MTSLGWLHVGAAAVALVTGSLVFVSQKGTRRHVRLGRLYAMAMLLVNLPALLLYEESGVFGAFHVLALVSLATLAAGLAPLLLGYRTRPHLARHGLFMAWSYVGLVAAGLAQLATAMFSGSGGVAVLLTSSSVVAVGGVIIHRLRARIERSSARGATPGVRPARGGCT